MRLKSSFILKMFVAMFNGVENYWLSVRERIHVRLQEQCGLEALVVKKCRAHSNLGKLSYRVQGGCLLAHSYTQEGPRFKRAEISKMEK